jgi:hypothetical protein
MLGGLLGTTAAAAAEQASEPPLLRSRPLRATARFSLVLLDEVDVLRPPHQLRGVGSPGCSVTGCV